MKKIRYDLVVLAETITQLIFILPRFSFFNMLKSFYLKLCKNKIGNNVIYYPGVFIMPPRNITIGDNVDLAKDVLITTSGGVDIGERALIGYSTKILTSNHNIPSGKQKIFSAGHTHKKVTIEKDVWIGANCIILPGVTIGEGSIIAAGSVITKDVDPFSIYAGVPAKKIRER